MSYTAKVWICGRSARAIVWDSEGRVVEINDNWNNIASLESELYDLYGNVQIKRGKESELKELNEEWNRCSNG